MGTSAASRGREQSQADEIANAVSHGIALVAALVGTPFLIVHAARRADAGYIVGSSVFSASVILLYLASTLYHALPAGKAKRALRVVDHSAITPRSFCSSPGPTRRSRWGCFVAHGAGRSSGSCGALPQPGWR